MRNKSEGSYGYPSNFVSTKEKLKNKWFLKYVKAAYNEMERSESFSVNSRTDRFISNRKRAEGLHNRDNVIKQFTQDVELIDLKMDYTVSTPLPKLVSIATRTIYNRAFVPQATPINSTARTKSDLKRKKLKAKMEMEKMRQRLEQNGVEGVDSIVPKPDGFIPDTDEDLELHMELNSKIGESISMEYMIRAGFLKNRMERIQKKVARDLVENKWAVVRVFFDNDNNINIKRVDIVNFIHPIVNEDDFSDARHLGEMMEMPISELRELSQGDLGEKELIDIADNHSISGESNYAFGQKRYYDNVYRDPSTYDDTKVRVVNLQIKQFDTSTYVEKKKRGGGFFFDKKSDDYQVPEGQEDIKVKHKGGAQAIYEGYWVVGSDYVFGYHKKSDVWRDRLNGRWNLTADFDYCVYAPNIRDMENKSIVEKLTFHDDRLAIIEYKVQQYLIKAAPPGYEYDIDRLKGAIKGMGFGKMKPIDMISLRTQSGHLFSRSVDEMGNPLPYANTANKLESGIDDGLVRLANMYNERLAIMKEVIGSNSAVDGSQPNAKDLVGVQKLAAEGHKAALSDLNEAYEEIITQVARRVCLGLQMQIRAGVNKQENIDMLGEANVKEVTLKDVEGTDFSISIEMLPEAYETEQLAADLQRMVESNPPRLAPEDKYIIMRVAKESILKAEKMLSYRSKKFQEREMERAEANAKAQADNQIRIAQETSKANQNEKQFTHNLDLVYLKEEYRLKIELEKAKSNFNGQQDRQTEVVKTDGKIEIIERAAELEEDSTENSQSLEGGFDRKGLDLEKTTMPPGVEPDSKVSIPGSNPSSLV
jgi:hypothetical protein